MRFDVHVHLFPPRMFEAVWKYFEDRSWKVHHQFLEGIRETLQAHGIEGATGLSYPHHAGVAASLNDFMERSGRDHPFFRPFASVHVDDVDMRAQVDRAIRSPHIFGFKFQPLVQRFDLNHPSLDYLYDACVEADFPLIIHAGTAPLATEHVGYDHFARLMSRHPGLRACVAHMGGAEFDGFMGLLDEYEGLFMDTTMINTRTDLFDNAWTGDHEMLVRHSHRICFGSDWPNVPYSYRDALDSIPLFGFPGDAVCGVMGENAARFLKLT